MSVDLGLARIWSGWKTIVMMPAAPVQRTYTMFGTYDAPRWSASPPQG